MSAAEVVVAGVAVTGTDGIATWTYPAGLGAVPVVAATPVASGRALVAVLEVVQPDHVVVRVVELPAGHAAAGVQVHLIAAPERAK